MKHLLKQTFLLFTIFILLIHSIDDKSIDYDSDDSMNTKNSTNTYSFTSVKSDTLSTAITSPSATFTESLIDQINFYHNIEILSRLKQCDSTMKLNDICELYSIDNKTKLLVKQTNIEFSTVIEIVNSLVDQSIIKELNKTCPLNQWCLQNLSDNNINFTINIIRERGHSFCALEQCNSRLLVFMNLCPTLSYSNITKPTLKLFPMLCSLYTNRLLNWNSNQCTTEIVYFLHKFYSFWFQFETCYDYISAGFTDCTPECKSFIDIINRVESQCNNNASFLLDAPILSWYKTMNQKRMCYDEILSTRYPLIYKIENYFVVNGFQLKRIYMILLPIVFVLILITCSLCFCIKLKRISRRTNYEYKRLNDPSFDLGPESEIINPDTDTIVNNEPILNSNKHLAEYRHLLRGEI